MSVERLHFMRNIIYKRKSKSHKEIERETLDYLMKKYIESNGIPSEYTSIEELEKEINDIHNKPCCKKIVSH